MGWKSPTGNDTPAGWTNPANARDDNTGTDAGENRDVDEEGYGPFLELTHAALNCDKVRFWYYSDDVRTEIDVDVTENGVDWIDVFEGVAAFSQWVEKDIPDSPRSIIAMRVRFNVITTDECDNGLHEVDFWEVEGIARPLVGGSLAYGSLVGKGLAR